MPLLPISRLGRNSYAQVARLMRFIHAFRQSDDGKTNKKSKDMKKIIIPILALCASAAIAADVVETTTIKTTTGNGTITEYEPGKTFIVKETSGPVTYRYGTTVTYVTRKGKTLSEDQVRARIKVGIPVWVHYVPEGDNRVISRIEVDDE